MITKEILEQKIKKAQESKDQAIASANYCQGVINNCEELLKELSDSKIVKEFPKEVKNE